MAVTENCVTFNAKLAVTFEFAFRVTEQSPVVHPVALPVPLVQPVKVEPALATAWRTSAVPAGYNAAQRPGASPCTLQVTVPVPVPAVEIVSVAGGGVVKLACTAEGVLRVIVHRPLVLLVHPVAFPVPELQLTNPVPSAVKVTEVPFVKSAEHVVAPLQ